MIIIIISSWCFVLSVETMSTNNLCAVIGAWLNASQKTSQFGIIIIIIIDFYGTYILRNLSSEAQQNRISRRNRKQGRAKVSIRTRDNRTFMVGMQFGIDMS